MSAIDLGGPAAPEAPAAALLATAKVQIENGNLGAAERLCNQALAAQPDLVAAFHLRSVIASRRGEAGLAIACLERATSAGPVPVQYRLELVEAYGGSGRLDEALRLGKQLAAAAPRDPRVLYVLANVHHDRRELDAAIACYERCLALQPAYAAARLRRGEALLARGDWPEGWRDYEWRQRLPGVAPVLPSGGRPWDGENGRGGTLVVIADQGFGDTIQFARFIPLAAQSCAQLAIGCSDEMRPIVAQMPGIARLFRHWNDMPRFQAWSSLSSLPGFFAKGPSAVPADIPYHRADAAKSAQWRDRLRRSLPRAAYRVGIVWAGRPTHPNDKRRSVRLAELTPLAELPGLAFVTLQKGPAEARVRDYRGTAPLIDLADEIRDFTDTAAIIDNLDLVVSVDTAVAHLAGAMGKPVWVLLPFAPDWRWMLERQDSPWYPTMRLFRQKAPGRWEEPIAAMAARLAARGSAGSR